MRNYTAIVEYCQDTGLYVGFIPGVPGVHTQAESLEELNRNLREVVAMVTGNTRHFIRVPGLELENWLD